MTPRLMVAILAAGASRRLGKPKQLVLAGNQPLVARQVETAISADIGDIVVIVGCNAHACRVALGDFHGSIVENENWADGLGTSIACAARAARERAASGVLLMQCDQYALTAANLRTLYEAWSNNEERTGNGVATSLELVATPFLSSGRVVRSRDGVYLGPPVIFPESCFLDLEKLSGDEGAKSVIKRLGPEKLIDVELTNASADLDTPEHLEQFEAWLRHVRQ